MNDAIMIIIMKNCNDFQELQMTSKNCKWLPR